MTIDDKLTKRNARKMKLICMFFAIVAWLGEFGCISFLLNTGQYSFAQTCKVGLTILEVQLVKIDTTR